MSGFIVLTDGRMYRGANWAYDATIRAISAALPISHGQLSRWLVTRTSEVKGPGMGSLDLRELTPENQDAIMHAIRVASESQPSTKPASWTDNDSYQIWKHKLSLLCQLVGSIVRKENPAMFDPFECGIDPPTSSISGPGWAEFMREETSQSMKEKLRLVEEVDWSYCEVSDEELKDLWLLPNLKALDLTSAPVTDASVRYLKTLVKLEEVSIAHTKISEEGIRVLRQWKSRLKISN